MNKLDIQQITIKDANAQSDGPAMLSGNGLRVTLEDGQEYLDAVSGTFNLPLGYNHPSVVSALHDQLDRITHLSSTLPNSEIQNLRRTLIDIAPPGIGAAWLRDITGSTAIEGAIKIAQKATGKRDVVSLFHSHHGQTIYGTGVSGNAFRRENQPDAALSSALQVPAPFCDNCFYGQIPSECGLMCATRIQDFIDYASSGQVAAIVIEPVQGNGGNIVPPPGYFTQLREICDRNCMLMIVDEVQTGIGRTGCMLACETFNIDPDIIVLGKGLGGIGVPVAAILMREHLDILEPHEHSFTSGGNLLSVAAARATLSVVGSPGFLDKVQKAGGQLEILLRSLTEKVALVSGCRGVGMMWGIDLVDKFGIPSAALATRLAQIALERENLILRTSRYGRGNTVKVRPALIATTQDLHEICSRLERSLQWLECEVAGV